MIRASLIVIAIVFVTGCDRTPKRRSSTQTEDEGAETPKTAAQIYVDRCAACHGKEGKGDGPTANTLNPRPRSFADPAWQASATDETLRKVIVGGGPAIGKSPLMPANPDFANAKANANADANGAASGDVVDGLIRALRGFNPALQKP